MAWLPKSCCSPGSESKAGRIGAGAGAGDLPRDRSGIRAGISRVFADAPKRCPIVPHCEVWFRNRFSLLHHWSYGLRVLCVLSLLGSTADVACNTTTEINIYVLHG